MIEVLKKSPYRLWSVGLVSTLSLVGCLNLSATRMASPLTLSVISPAEASTEERPDDSGDLAALARRNPMAFIRLAQEHVNTRIRDYTATFLKQEQIGGRLGPVQNIDIRFRSAPVSVFMHWRENADQARRVVYQDTPEFRDGKGRKIARIEPAGIIARALVSQVTREIDGADARAASRRTIGEFGFKSTLDLFERYNRLAIGKTGRLDLRYAGEGSVDGRPTFVLERRLPYTPGGPYPDAKLVVHFDQEWLAPTAVYSFADEEGTLLLGSYVFTNVRINPGLSNSDFSL